VTCTLRFSLASRRVVRDELAPSFAALCRWAMEHVAEIERSRAQVVDDMIAKHERELAAEPSA